MAQSKNEFYLRRIHSLLGIIPIGAFLVVHLLVNHQATQGAEAFNKASNFMESLPFLIIVEFLFIYIPLLYHGLFGIHIAFTAKENVGHYSIFRNWMFFFQRVSGILTFIFIGIHLWQTRLQKAFYGKEVNYDLMHETLQHPGWAIFLYYLYYCCCVPLCKWLMVILSYLGWTSISKITTSIYMGFINRIFSYFVYWCYCNYCLYVIHRI